MKISELIKELNTIKEQYGDIPVHTYIDEWEPYTSPIYDCRLSTKTYRKISSMPKKFESTTVPPYVIVTC